MTLSTLMHALGDAASTRQLRQAGLTDRALTLAVREGRLVRPRNGVYAVPELAESTMTALRLGGRLSCVSAARSYGLWGGHDARLHIRVPGHAGRSGAGAVRHWGASEAHAEIWRVSFADCLRTVVQCADVETAVAVLDTAIGSGRVTMTALTDLFASEPLASRATAALARPGSDSGVESILRQRLTARGHHVEQQLAVAGVGRVDLRVDGSLFVEIDGFAYHSDHTAFERDRLRDTALALSGARWLRFPARQVIDHPDTVVATIEMMLKREGIRP